MKKSPVEKARKAAVDFHDLMIVSQNDRLCIGNSNVETQPIATIMTGTPFWAYQHTPEDTAWLPKNINGVFYLTAYDRPEPFTVDKVKEELEIRIAEDPNFKNPFFDVVGPFALNGIEIEGSVAMLVDESLYKNFSFRKSITWKGTAVVRCTVDALLKSLCPDQRIKKEDGTWAGYDDMKEPDDLGKAIGMGYEAMVRMPLNVSEKRWRLFIGLIKASRANGIELDSLSYDQIRRESIK